MTHAVMTTFERMAARRNGAVWRRHVLNELAKRNEADARPQWSRAWLSRHARQLKRR